MRRLLWFAGISLISQVGLWAVTIGCSATNSLAPPSYIVNGITMSSPPPTYSDGLASGTWSACPAVAMSVAGSANGAFVTDSLTFTTRYYFQVTGGNVGDVVPVNIQGLLFAQGAAGDEGNRGSSEAEITANLDVENSNGQVYLIDQGLGVTVGQSLTKSWNSVLNITAYSGGINEVDLNIGLYVLAVNGFANGSAYADPHIFIDPSFANAGNYSIQVSSGIGNALAASPEPGTFALGGLALVAFG